MSEQTCCAHCKVLLKHKDHPDGTRSDYWECADGCGAKFISEKQLADERLARQKAEKACAAFQAWKASVFSQTRVSSELWNTMPSVEAGSDYVHKSKLNELREEYYHCGKLLHEFDATFVSDPEHYRLEEALDAVFGHIEDVSHQLDVATAELAEISGVVGIPPLAAGEPVPSVLNRVRRVSMLLKEQIAKQQQQMIAKDTQLDGIQFKLEEQTRLYCAALDCGGPERGSVCGACIKCLNCELDAAINALNGCVKSLRNAYKVTDGQGTTWIGAHEALAEAKKVTKP